MRVLLWSDHEKAIAGSGVGRAKEHQKLALDTQENVTYSSNPRQPYDVIHINTIFTKSLRQAKIAHQQGLPVVYHAHSTQEDFANSFIGSNLLAPLFGKWLRYVYSFGDVLITPSHYSASLLRSYGLTQPIQVISNGIDLDFWHASDEEISDLRATYLPKGKKGLIMSCGLQIERKGIKEFIDLAKFYPDYEFVWFGYTDPHFIPSDVRKAMENAGENVNFAGYVARERMRIAYQASDAFVFMTHEETEGIVLLEALASRTPTIVRDLPVFSDYEDGKDLYKAVDQAAFKKQLDGVLHHTLPSTVENGYKKVQTRRLDVIGEQLVKAYQLAIEIYQQKNQK